MASEGRREAASLKRLVMEHSGRFEFLQAVRLLKKIRPDRDPVGGDSDPRNEIVRFSTDVSPVFPISDIQDAVEPEGDGPIRLQVNFMGAATPSSFGALPRRYAEEIRRLARDKNTALRDFIDVFNHRMISLFYRAREKNFPTLAYDRGGNDNAFEHALSGVLGIGTPGLSGQLSLDDRMILGRGGLIASHPIGVSALEGLIRSVFGQPVEIEQFCPAQYPIEADDRNGLGFANSVLGEDLYLGSEITLVQSRIRIRLGPMSREAYEEFLPHHLGFQRLSDLVHLAVGEELDFEVCLSLRADEVPTVRLGVPSEDSVRLGWSSWIGSEERTEPAEDATIDPRFNRGVANEQYAAQSMT
ncbi:MAG: type VI secretion system protein ImpH [Myxococcota bacterium]|jgi:type VI secretion system protein ImpH